ncbi:MAG TPA: type II secretion system major pseudopilin GspG [Chthoniobacteraceae bacterium]|jgi:general secretion pathway protein G|nr:type II secretion system major pseudopilin GspG [Chthoniobacteraceae bacterium]
MVHHGGRQLGPYSIDEAQARLGAGEFFATDLAWVEGSPSWVPLSSILSGGVGEANPALPAPYPPAGYAVYQTRSTELATTSLVLGLLSFFCFSFLAGIPAIICGHKARGRVQRAPEQFGGAGMALAGLILGYFSLLPLVFIPFAIVLPILEGRGEMAKTTATRAQIGAFTSALEAFEIDTGSYPTSSEGLDALVGQPANRPNWKGPYLSAIPQDPWGHAYVYRYPGKEHPKSFDLVSGGPDGRVGTTDDVGPGDEGRLNEEVEDSSEAKGK